MANAKGWEIVEKRGDGLWSTIMRTTVPDEGVTYRNWVLAHDASRYALREFEVGQPPLTSSVSFSRQVDSLGRSNKRMMDESKARRVGQELATSLVSLFMLREQRDPGAVYALARTFAAMTGEFDDADIRDAFIEGIMAGFRSAPAQIAAPRMGREVDG